MSFPDVGAGARPSAIVSLGGEVSRRPGWIRRLVRLGGKGVRAFFKDATAARVDALRPRVDDDALAVYLAVTNVIVSAARRHVETQSAHIAPGDIEAIGPVGGPSLHAGLGRVTASEILAVVLAPGVSARWLSEGVLSKAIGDLVLTLQTAAQAARRDRPSHRVYVIVYESGAGKGDPVLVALNLEACRRPADAVLEAGERARLIDALRRRFGADAVARAALVGCEPSLILDSQLATEPRRRFATGVRRDAA